MHSINKGRRDKSREAKKQNSSDARAKPKTKVNQLSPIKKDVMPKDTKEPLSQMLIDSVFAKKTMNSVRWLATVHSLLTKHWALVCPDAKHWRLSLWQQGSRRLPQLRVSGGVEVLVKRNRVRDPASRMLHRRHWRGTRSGHHRRNTPPPQRIPRVQRGLETQDVLDSPFQPLNKMVPETQPNNYSSPPACGRRKRKQENYPPADPGASTQSDAPARAPHPARRTEPLSQPCETRACSCP